MGSVLATRRRKLGMTRAQVAEQAGVSINTLMKVEQGHTLDPGVLKIHAICLALQLTVDKLVDQAFAVHSNASCGLVSIGYEGKEIDSFIASLSKASVRTLVDVRLNPISRKPGFSKTRLRDGLAAAGIDYLHMRALGNPKDNRAPFWSGDVATGRATYRGLLRVPEARLALEELAALASQQTVALLCFEADRERCHRHVVIEEIQHHHPVTSRDLG